MQTHHVGAFGGGRRTAGGGGDRGQNRLSGRSGQGIQLWALLPLVLQHPARPDAAAPPPAGPLPPCRWAGNNVTRPFRLAGAAALAPFMDKVMDRLQARLGLRSKAGAFAILTAAVAGVCFALLGGLFFSRWVRG